MKMNPDYCDRCNNEKITRTWKRAGCIVKIKSASSDSACNCCVARRGEVQLFWSECIPGILLTTDKEIEKKLDRFACCMLKLAERPVVVGNCLFWGQYRSASAERWIAWKIAIERKDDRVDPNWKVVGWPQYNVFIRKKIQRALLNMIRDTVLWQQSANFSCYAKTSKGKRIKGLQPWKKLVYSKHQSEWKV